MIPDLAWTASGGIRITPSPTVTGFGRPPQPGSAAIDRAGTIGPFSVTVAFGPPLNTQTTVVGFAYERVSLGCAFGNDGGVRFDERGIPRYTSRPNESDTYITGPVLTAIEQWTGVLIYFTNRPQLVSPYMFRAALLKLKSSLPPSRPVTGMAR